MRAARPRLFRLAIFMVPLVGCSISESSSSLSKYWEENPDTNTGYSVR